MKELFSQTSDFQINFLIRLHRFVHVHIVVNTYILIVAFVFQLFLIYVSCSMNLVNALRFCAVCCLVIICSCAVMWQWLSWLHWLLIIKSITISNINYLYFLCLQKLDFITPSKVCKSVHNFSFGCSYWLFVLCQPFISGDFIIINSWWHSPHQVYSLWISLNI